MALSLNSVTLRGLGVRASTYEFFGRETIQPITVTKWGLSQGCKVL